MGSRCATRRISRVLEADKSRHQGCSCLSQRNGNSVTSSVKAVREVSIISAIRHCSLLTVSARSAPLNSAWKTGALMSPYQVHKKVSCSRQGWQLSVSVRKLWSRRNGNSPVCFFDYNDMVKTNDLGYFPYTPAATLCAVSVHRWICCLKVLIRSPTSPPPC